MTTKDEAKSATFSARPRSAPMPDAPKRIWTLPFTGRHTWSPHPQPRGTEYVRLDVHVELRVDADRLAEVLQEQLDQVRRAL